MACPYNPSKLLLDTTYLNTGSILEQYILSDNSQDTVYLRVSQPLYTIALQL